MKFSLQRVAAEALALIDYRRFKALFWRLRAGDIRRRYAYTDDFPILRGFLERYRVRSVADVGCGDGRLFPLYKECGIERLFAIELSEPLYREAQRRVDRGEAPPQTQLVLGDLSAPPAPPACDLVVAARTLQHIVPAEVAQVARWIATVAQKAVYVNETLEGKPRAAYMFRHDYDALFAPFGFSPAGSGRIPNVDYEYRLYEKRA